MGARYRQLPVSVTSDCTRLLISLFFLNVPLQQLKRVEGLNAVSLRGWINC